MFLFKAIKPFVLARQLAKVGILLLACAVSLTVPAEAAKKKDEFKKAPIFPKEGVWLNSKPAQKPFRDKLTMVYFWDYNSIHSLRELQYLKGWFELYHPYGFEMLFVHSPEFEFAQKKENVQMALDRLQITNPVYLDNEFLVWDAYKVLSWPTKFLVNKKGRIIHTQIGEGYYATMENKIRAEIEKLNQNAVLPMPLVRMDHESYDAEVCGQMSAETSLGYKQQSWWSGEFANEKGVLPDQTHFYEDYGARVEHGFFAHGEWTNRSDHFELARNTSGLTDYLGIIYSAHEVYTTITQNDWQEAVSKSSGEVHRVYVTRDGEPVPPALRGPDLMEDSSGKTYFLVDEPRLYYLVSREDDTYHELKLFPQRKGLAINSFSFSNRCLSEFEHL